MTFLGDLRALLGGANDAESLGRLAGVGGGINEARRLGFDDLWGPMLEVRRTRPAVRRGDSDVVRMLGTRGAKRPEEVGAMEKEVVDSLLEMEELDLSCAS